MPLTAARKINNIISLPFSVLDSGKLTFPEFLEELDSLGLKGEKFGPESYRIALRQYLGIDIEVILVDDLQNIEAQQAFVERDDTAILLFRPDQQCAYIFVLASLSEMELTAAVYHELSHLAAGHQLIRVRQVGRDVKSVAAFPKRLAKEPPPRRHKACEKEARIREDYCILAGSLGEECLKADQFRQAQ